MKNKYLLRAAVLLLTAGLTACSGSGKPDNTSAGTGGVLADNLKEPADASGVETWSVYWYLCGSDLESQLGFATKDMEEMLSVRLPKNVQVIIETGGANEWKREGISNEVLQRYIYDYDGLRKIDELTDENMGAGETLKDFLSFCLEEYPADHQVMIFWDHGGGVLGGVSYDEKYYMQSLSLPVITEVFDEVCEGKEEPVFDLVGFDACLMATLDTANAISEEARYMVASQELEPGNGWNYKGIYTAFAENPKLKAEELGVIICDTFMEGCKEYGTEMESTLAMIDLGKAETLFQSYSTLGDSLLLQSVEDDTLFAAVSRAVEGAERYGGNSDEEGYTNMVDLGCMVDNMDFLPEETTKAVKENLKDCVLYQVQGEYKKYGNGLSIYYPLDRSMRSVMHYEKASSFEPYSNFYHYQVFGALTDNAKSYIATKSAQSSYGSQGGSTVFGSFFTRMKDELIAGSENVVSAEEMDNRAMQMTSVRACGVENAAVEINEENELVMHLGDAANYLSRVSGFVGWTPDLTAENLISPGAMPIQYADYRTGEFRDPIKKDWWYLNGHMVFTLPVEDTKDYSTYIVPLTYRGEMIYLRFSEDKRDGTIRILGARRPAGENYMSSKEVIFLHKGDEIGIQIAQNPRISNTEKKSLRDYETIILEEEPVISRGPLPDGLYITFYMMYDVWGNYVYSDYKSYDLVNGEIVIPEYADEQNEQSE